jgi:hypothetical protein
MNALRTFCLDVSGLVACWLYLFSVVAFLALALHWCGATWPDFRLLVGVSSLATVMFAVCAWDDEDPAADCQAWWFYCLRYGLPPLCFWRLGKWLAKRAHLVPL